jgi:hypothetical protein
LCTGAGFDSQGLLNAVGEVFGVIPDSSARAPADPDQDRALIQLEALHLLLLLLMRIDPSEVGPLDPSCGHVIAV